MLTTAVALKGIPKRRLLPTIAVAAVVYQVLPGFNSTVAIVEGRNGFHAIMQSVLAINDVRSGFLPLSLSLCPRPGSAREPSDPLLPRGAVHVLLALLEGLQDVDQGQDVQRRGGGACESVERGEEKRQSLVGNAHVNSTYILV